MRWCGPSELAIAHWDQMAAGYSVLELSTAVKPWLLRHLLHDRGVPDITYLDPDIQVFDSLDEVSELLTGHAVVVNPHLTAAMPRDGHRPTETDILISGSFNLGFAAFAPDAEVDQLLDWWSERLATDCLVAPERGYFVDQRWMDLAPGLIPSLCHPARRRLQRGLLEPVQPRCEARRRPLHRQRPPAALLSLLRV